MRFGTVTGRYRALVIKVDGFVIGKVFQDIAVIWFVWLWRVPWQMHDAVG
jgi:hypothetical protein